MICHKSDSNSKELAVDFLRRGKILILPTDTVYGFSASVEPRLATDRKIRRIKGREETKPFIQLIASPADLKKYSDDYVPDSLLSFWPGALTIIVSRSDGEGTTAFRCPGDLWLRQVIEGCGFPVYSTSANRSGSPVLGTERALLSEFGNDVDLIVLDGDVEKGLPSTLVRIQDGKSVVLRQGAVRV